MRILMWLIKGLVAWLSAPPRCQLCGQRLAVDFPAGVSGVCATCGKQLTWHERAALKDVDHEQ